MRGLPSQVKGDRFRAYSRRSSCVRIALLALNFIIFISYIWEDVIWHYQSLHLNIFRPDESVLFLISVKFHTEFQILSACIPSFIIYLKLLLHIQLIHSRFLHTYLIIWRICFIYCQNFICLIVFRVYGSPVLNIIPNFDTLSFLLFSVNIPSVVSNQEGLGK